MNSAPPPLPPVDQMGAFAVTSSDEVRRLADAKRLALGLSSEAVAKRAGFSKCAYWRWQRDRRQVTLEAALCYLTVLGFRITITPADRA